MSVINIVCMLSIVGSSPGKDAGTKRSTEERKRDFSFNVARRNVNSFNVEIAET